MINRIDEIYQEIADVLVDAIPENWRQVKVYAEVAGIESSVFFYYYPTKSDTAVFSADIPKKFKAYKDLYAQLLEELEVTFSQLWFELKEENDEPWTSVTYTLTDEGEVNVHFSYDDLSMLSVEEKQHNWETKNL